MSIFSSLRKEQKEAVGLLQLGTFLEYFDFMLYIHMAVLLNDLYFPKTDPHTSSLLASFAFCSSWMLRPLGALIFGYIGDRFGRKTTVIMTTMMMAVSCIAMALLPTYEQIGIAAAWGITICRIFQSFSSMAEITGAEIYLTEITKPPVRYPVVAFVSAGATIGSFAALGVATMVTSYSFDWRYAFWAGALIAVIGVAARTKLRETPDFVDMKRRMKRAIEAANPNNPGKAAEAIKSINSTWKEKTDKKTILAYFLICSGRPVCFYFIFVYCSELLKNVYSFSPAQVIHNNMLVVLIDLLTTLLFVFLTAKIHPLKIQRFNFLCFFIPFMLLFPHLFNNFHTASTVFWLQVVCSVFTMGLGPASSVYTIHFPVYRRFSYLTFLFAISRSIMGGVFLGIVYLTDSFGHYGLWIVMIPVVIGYGWGLWHFIKLEKLYSPDMYTTPKAHLLPAYD